MLRLSRQYHSRKPTKPILTSHRPEIGSLSLRAIIKQENCPIFDEALQLPEPFPEHVPRLCCREGKPGARHPISLILILRARTSISSAWVYFPRRPNVGRRSAGAPFLTPAEAHKRRAPRAPAHPWRPSFPQTGILAGPGRSGAAAGRARRARNPAGAASGTLPGGRAAERGSLAEGKRAPGSRLLWDVGLPGPPGSLPASYCTVS